MCCQNNAKIGKIKIEFNFKEFWLNGIDLFSWEKQKMAILGRLSFSRKLSLIYFRDSLILLFIKTLISRFIWPAQRKFWAYLFQWFFNKT